MRYLYVVGSDPDVLQQSVNNLAAEDFEPVGPVSWIPIAFYRDPLARDHPERLRPMAPPVGEPGGLLLQLMRKGG